MLGLAGLRIRNRIQSYPHHFDRPELLFGIHAHPDYLFQNFQKRHTVTVPMYMEDIRIKKEGEKDVSFYAREN